MREERLMERVRRWEQQPPGRGRENPQRTIESVVRHLQQLLKPAHWCRGPELPSLMHFYTIYRPEPRRSYQASWMWSGLAERKCRQNY